MLSVFADSRDAARAVPLHAVVAKDLERFLSSRPLHESRWLRTAGFGGKDGELAFIPGQEEELAGVVLGLGAGRYPLALALFSERLSEGVYALGDVPAAFAGVRAAYAWAIGT